MDYEHYEPEGRVQAEESGVKPKKNPNTCSRVAPGHPCKARLSATTPRTASDVSVLFLCPGSRGV